jgi:Photosynthetic reaction centre cytochrome C subunit
MRPVLLKPVLLKTIAGGLLIAGLAVAPALLIAQTPPSTPPQAPATPPSTLPSHEHESSGTRPADNFDSAKALTDLQKLIAGKEEQPAEAVFKNVQMFKGVPSARLLGAMNAFTKALGVTCKKCHDPENWASDDKHEKKAARGMMAMTGDINGKYLKDMEGVDDDASVNCGTCHRGHAHPDAGMRPPSGGGGH